MYRIGGQCETVKGPRRLVSRGSPIKTSGHIRLQTNFFLSSKVERIKDYEIERKTLLSRV